MNYFIRVSSVVAAVAGAGLFCGMSLAQNPRPSQGAKQGQKQTARSARAKPQAADQGQDQDGPRGHHHPRAKALAMAMLIENPPKVDANGDGTISDDERAAAHDAVKAQILSKFDANKNGEIDPEERDAIRDATKAKVLERFDANKNGQIDQDEREAIHAAVHQKMLDTFDANANGVIDENERPHFGGGPGGMEKDGGPGHRGFGPLAGRPGFRQHILEKFDANGDGKLDENERAAAKDEIHQKMLDRFDTNGNGVIDENERPLRRGSGMGPGGRLGRGAQDDSQEL